MFVYQLQKCEKALASCLKYGKAVLNLVSNSLELRLLRALSHIVYSESVFCLTRSSRCCRPDTWYCQVNFVQSQNLGEESSVCCCSLWVYQVDWGKGNGARMSAYKFSVNVECYSEVSAIVTLVYVAECEGHGFLWDKKANSAFQECP